MAAAVAAHECGHAVQHARAYAPLTMRSKLVPVVSFASQWMTWLLLGGILLLNTFPQLLLAGIILFAMTTLFSFVTLPVEIDANKRALVWLSRSGITNSYNHKQAEDALRSAAYTYVVAALGSLATLIYYIMIFYGTQRLSFVSSPNKRGVSQSLINLKLNSVRLLLLCGEILFSQLELATDFHQVDCISDNVLGFLYHCQINHADLDAAGLTLNAL